MMPLNKEIDTDDQDEHQLAKVVKLRFTRKQYQSFRDACKIFEIVSLDPGFFDFVKSALGADVKVPTITKQLVQPIIEAPTKIPMKLPRAAKSGEVKRESYFTAPMEATDRCVLLHSKAGDGVELKQNIQEGVTCVTDVRVMVGRYISSEKLRNEQGIVVDGFIRKLAPKSLSSNSDQLLRIDGKHVIPKGNRKIMTDIVNEVVFGE